MSAKKLFIVESHFTKGDTFGMMGEPQSYYSFLCTGYTDLYKTLKCLRAKGRRTRKPAYYSNWFKKWQSPMITLNIFRVKSEVIHAISEAPTVTNELEYTNSWGFTHKLKLIENQNLPNLYDDERAKENTKAI